MRQLEDGELDLMIVPSTMISDQHPAELLFEERHVIAGWARNPLLGRPMSQEEFIRAGHVVVEIGNVLRVSFAEAGLRRLGIQRRGEIIVTSFSIVPKLLIGTNRLAIMHERLACDAAKSLPISYTAPPFDLGIMSEMAQYHRARADDPSLRWLIETIRTSVPVIDEIG